MRQLLRRRGRPPVHAAWMPLSAGLELDPRDAAFVDPLLERAIPPMRPACGPVSTELYERLTADNLAEIEAALEGSLRELWDRASADERVVLAPMLAAVYDVTDALQRLGLVRAAPPPDVHAMARGPLAYGGEPVLADLVVRAFAQARCELPASDATVLDFGSSSGRVLRVLAAYRPDLQWLGCDPNEGAVAWAAQHLPMARFFASPILPPLDLPDGSVDRVYAISIWSHFSAVAAARWLRELHRIVKPGGALMLTSHGLDTIASQMRSDLMTPGSAADAAAGLLSCGTKFFSIFGEDGDWGVKDPDWGTGYLSVDWLSGQVTPQWAIRLFRPGMLDGNQDVFVLERRP